MSSTSVTSASAGGVPNGKVRHIRRDTNPFADDFRSTLKGKVKTILGLSTVPHPLIQSGDNVDPAPSQQFDADLFRTFRRDYNRKVYAHMPSRFPRSGSNRAFLFENSERSSGISHGVPFFTGDLKFSDLTVEEVRAYVKRMSKSVMSFVSAIEERDIEVDLIHSAHLFLNTVMAGKLNRTRISNGDSPLPVVAVAHGDDVDFLEREMWLQELHEPERFGPSNDPFNVSISRGAFDHIEGLYGDALRRRSEYATMLGTSALEFLRGLTSPTLMGFRSYVAPYIYSGVGIIVAVSDDVRRRVLQTFPNFPRGQITTIYNGFDPNVFKPISFGGREEFKNYRRRVLASLRTSRTTGGKRLPMELHDADYVVVSSGELTEQKGIIKLIKAAAGNDPDATKGGVLFDGYERVLRDSGMSVVTLHMGTNKNDPEFVRSVERLPGELGARNFFFLGDVKPEMVAMVNSIADIGVYPANEEPFNMEPINAMAQGLAVLVGRGGIRDVVTEEAGGFVDFFDPQQIASQVMRALIENWKEAKGVEAVESAQDYTWLRQLREYLNVYEVAYNWVTEGHPVYKPRRLTALQPRQSLKQIWFSPNKVAVEVVKLAHPERISDALKAATVVKNVLCSGFREGERKARRDIVQGNYKGILERVEAQIDGARRARAAARAVLRVP